MTGEKYKGYIEIDQYTTLSLDGKKIEVPDYGEDPGDDCYKLPVERKESEVRYSNDDGTIVDRNLGSTKHTQTTGNLVPIDA